jgi:hypothetical protein
MKTKPIPETRGRKPKTDWASMQVGTGFPATPGAAHYQNRMAQENGSKRHYVYRCINGVGHVFRSR